MNKWSKLGLVILGITTPFDILNFLSGYVFYAIVVPLHLIVMVIIYYQSTGRLDSNSMLFALTMLITFFYQTVDILVFGLI